MREFFHGWRRKVGCVALVMACVLACVWLRSLITYDVIHQNVGERNYGISSCEGRLTLVWFSFATTEPFVWHSGDVSKIDYFFRAPEPGEPKKPYDPLREWRVIWRWDWGGFHVGAGETGDPNNLTQIVTAVFPYAALVIPLTLLSAYLILWKPRQRTEAEHA